MKELFILIALVILSLLALLQKRRMEIYEKKFPNSVVFPTLKRFYFTFIVIFACFISLLGSSIIIALFK